MDHRLGRAIIAFAGACALGAWAQQSAAPSPSVALPPQNYGTQPGFFRGAAEMAAFANPSANVAAPIAPPAAVPAAPVAVAAPAVAAVPVAASAIADTRIPDPTQNLQWAERQADRSEAAAQQQRAQEQAAPPPVAPGAYNGQTNPADR
jgi:hypothetical protein